MKCDKKRTDRFRWRSTQYKGKGTDMYKFRAMVVAIATCIGTSAANASFIGDSVSCAIATSSFNFFASCSPTSAVVDGGTEFVVNTTAGVDYKWGMDIGASSVIFRDNSVGGTDGYHGTINLTDFDWVGGSAIITGIANFATTVTRGISASDISFTADSITIDATYSNWTPGQQLSFDIVTNAVPEPASLFLVSVGVLGLGLSRRKKA